MLSKIYLNNIISQYENASYLLTEIMIMISYNKAIEYQVYKWQVFCYIFNTNGLFLNEST